MLLPRHELNMIHCFHMSTVTIPKKEYEELKKDAGAWRKAIQGLRTDRGKAYTEGTKQIFGTLVNGKKGVAKKKLPAGLRQALREVAQGKLSGPFNSVDDLMAHLRR